MTLSLPSHLGRDGLTEVLMPTLAEDEARALDESAATLRRAVRSIESVRDETKAPGHVGP